MLCHRLTRKSFLLLIALFHLTCPIKAQSELIINEIMPANVDVFVDPSFNFGGWIEIYNLTDQCH